MWTPENGFLTLPFPGGTFDSHAYDINDSGMIVGEFEAGDDGLSYLAFLHDGQTMTVIPPAPGTGLSQAFAINDSGLVAGTTGDPVTLYHRAFRWDGKEMTLIAPTIGPRTGARDLNERGDVVGWMGTGVGIDSHAFMWDGVELMDLGLPEGVVATSGEAINDRGQIAANTEFASGHPGGLINGGAFWEDGKWTDLGMLPGYVVMDVTDLNDRGQVVGLVRRLEPINDDQPFLWQKGAMIDLQDVLVPGTTVTGLVRVQAINQSGQIVVYGSVSTWPARVTLLLTPIARAGDVDGDCVVNADDLMFLIDDWGQARSPADLDQDGTVGIRDLLTLLSNWGG